MQITHYLAPDEIIAPLKGKNKKEIYEELVEHIAKLNGLKDTKKLLNAIMEREKSTSTFLPMSIAIPHARVPDIDDIVFVIGVSKKPIKDEGAGALPLSANVFCLFFSPTEEKDFGKHLKLLARIAGVFSDTNLVTEISKMDSADKVFERIQLRERAISEE